MKTTLSCLTVGLRRPELSAPRNAGRRDAGRTGGSLAHGSSARPGNARGFSARNESPSPAYDATISVRFERYTSCFPSRDQVGWIPPAVEICHFPPGPGNGRTYTSGGPDSSETYATQRPSGENTASRSTNGVRRKAVAFPGFHPETSSPSMGRIMMSRRVSALSSSYARNFPAGCHEVGYCRFLDSVSRPRFARSVAIAANTSSGSSRPHARRRNAIRRPSGVHTGAVSLSNRTSGAPSDPVPTRRPRHRVVCRLGGPSRAVGHPERNAGCCKRPARRAAVGVSRPGPSSRIGATVISRLGPRTKANVPLAENANCAVPFDGTVLIPSRTGTDGPVSSSRSKSKGTPKRVPSCMYTMWPLGR